MSSKYNRHPPGPQYIPSSVGSPGRSTFYGELSGAPHGVAAGHRILHPTVSATVPSEASLSEALAVEGHLRDDAADLA